MKNPFIAVAMAAGLLTIECNAIQFALISSTNSVPLAAIAATGDFGVAVGSNGTTIAFMPADGTIVSFSTNVAPRTNLASVVYGNGRFVAGGSNANLFSTSDGFTWSRLASGIPPNSFAQINGLAFASSEFFALPLSLRVYRSPIGNLNGTWLGSVTSYAKNQRAICSASANRLVQVGDNGWIAVSTDFGTNFFPHAPANSVNLLGVAWGGDSIVAVGVGGAVQRSTNGGTNWTAVTSGITKDLVAVTYVGDRFRAVGNGGTILESTDGSSWTADSSGSSANLTGVTFADSGPLEKLTFVSGSDGKILVGGDLPPAPQSDWNNNAEVTCYVSGATTYSVNVTNLPATANVDWFAQSSGGTPLLSNSLIYTFSSPADNPSAPVTSNVWAQSRDTRVATFTSAQRTEVSLIINPRPTAVVSGTTTICTGDSTPLQAALGGVGPWTVAWSSNGVPIATHSDVSGPNDTLTVSLVDPNPNAPTTYTYTVSTLSDANCTANLEDITGEAVVTVNQKSADPTSATAAASTICNGQSTTLSLVGGGGGTGETIHWYTGSCGGTAVGTGNGLSVSPATTTTYFGRYEDGAPCGFNSACASVTVTVNQKSADPTSATAAASTICNGQSTTLSLVGGGGGTGETIHWYTGSCGGTAVGTGNGLSVSPATTTTYFGRYEDGAPCGFNSACASVTVTVNQKSADPTSATAAASTICNGQSTTLSLVGGGGGTGETIHWYTGSCGGTAVGTGNGLSVSPATTTTYFGRYEDGAPCGFNSACASVTVTVNQKSADPTSATAAASTICNGQSTTLSLVGGGGGTGETIHWYTGSCGGTAVGTGNGLSVSPATTTTYFGRYEDGAPCSFNSACASVTVTVNQKSADPTSASASPSTICNGQSTTLSLVGGGGGTGEIHWYTGSCGGTAVGTGNGLSVGPTTTTTYFGRYEDGAPCSFNSACALVTVTVNRRPTALVSGSTNICNGSSAVVTAAVTAVGSWTLTWSSNGVPVAHTGVGSTNDSLKVSPPDNNGTGPSTNKYTVTALSDNLCTANTNDLTGSAIVIVSDTCQPQLLTIESTTRTNFTLRWVGPFQLQKTVSLPAPGWSIVTNGAYNAVNRSVQAFSTNAVFYRLSSQ